MLQYAARFFRVFIFVLVCFLCETTALEAAQFLRASDTITTSLVDTPAGHEISIKTTNDIPEGGSFVVEFAGASPFTLLSDMSYLDADFAVATGTGDYLEFPLAETSTATSTGVLVADGENGSIVFSLGSDSSFRIPAGSRIRIRLGPSAVDGAIGSWPITNPASAGSALIRIHSEDGSSAVIDRADILDYILVPIEVSAMVVGREAVMSNPLPKGLLPGGTKKVYMSMATDLPAYCRWSLTENEPYALRSIGQQFKSQSAFRHHYYILDVADNTHYTYFVRCFTKYGLQENLTDLKIDFEIGMVPNEPRPPAPPPKPAGTENGTGAGGGNRQFQSGVSLSGRAFPGASIVVLMDGKDYDHPTVNSNGEWKTQSKQLDRGNYGFNVVAYDAEKRNTARYNTVLAVTPSSNNAIGPILMSPTLSAPNNRIDPGQKTIISGRAIAGQQVMVVVLTPTDPLQQPLITASTSARGDGTWSLALSTENFNKGTYNIKAQSRVKDKGDSLFSDDYLLGVGEAPKGVKKGGDINGDKKVGLADLSMVLSHWSQAYLPCDLNGDGKVGLPDLSILLSGWTG
jgi:hypothetical protein